MALCPFAEYLGPVPNKDNGGMQDPVIGLILHVIVGTITAANTVFHDPSKQASAHFGVGQDGRLYQWVDSHDKAWAEGAGNALYWSVETEGQPTEALTEAQCQTIAKLYNWLRSLNAAAPIPYVITNTPGGSGFGIHSMGGTAWGGHTGCPGSLRSSQRQHILDLAQQVQPQPEQPEDEDTMYKVVYKGAANDSARRGQFLIIGSLVLGITNQLDSQDADAAGAKPFAVDQPLYDKIASLAK